MVTLSKDEAAVGVQFTGKSPCALFRLREGLSLTQVRLAWLDLTGTVCEKALAEEHVSEGSPVKEEVLSVLRISVLSSVVNVFVCMCSCAPCACLVPTEVRRWC